MPMFKITRIMQYTEVAEVEADDTAQAREMIANSEIEFERNHDDHLYDDDVRKV